MESHIRDTVFGHFLRLISNNRLLKFPDERDSSLWKQSVNQHAPGSDAEKAPNPDPSNNSNDEVDCTSEANQDVYLVEWYSPEDPEVPNNMFQLKFP